MHSDRWVGNVNIRLQKFMKNVAKNGGFRFVPSSFLHNTQHIILLFKSTHLGLIFKKRYTCGVPYAAVFKVFYVKVDQVTMYYIGPGNW